MSSSLLLLFVDGIGLAPAGEDNPFSTTETPGLEWLLGGRLTRETVVRRDAWREGVLLREIDACLGVPGLPQSGTGQTALFTGVNAALLIGRHVVAFPGPRLRSVLRDHGLFRRARELGLECAFANAFSKRYWELLERRRLRRSASVVLAEAGGVRLRDLEDLRAGRAVSWDVERDQLARGGEESLESVDAVEAGRHLHALAIRNDITLYETFLTDLAGHRRGPLSASEAVRRVDGLILGLLGASPVDRLTVVLVSDHGNLEEAGHRRHTRNPVPLIAWGPEAKVFRNVCSLTGLVASLFDASGVHESGGRSLVSTSSGWGPSPRSTQDVGVRLDFSCALHVPS